MGTLDHWILVVGATTEAALHGLVRGSRDHHRTVYRVLWNQNLWSDGGT